MTDILLDLLVMDHKRIQALYADLKAQVEGDGVHNEEACLNLFRTLKALISAHAKAEEYTLYARFDVDKKRPIEELQHFALEGYEEHDLVDKILKEMGQAEEICPQWRAQLTVLTELLQRHIEDEEKDFFPRVHALLEREQLLTMGSVYLMERDQIFAKKCGVNMDASTAAKVPSGAPARLAGEFQTSH